jgi:O-antigen/teichoic acid export membrane protein
MLKRILRGAGADAIKYFPVRFVPALTSLITVRLFTSMIPPAEYGDFSLVTSGTSLLSTIAAAWVAGSAMRYYWVYQREERLDEYTSTTVWASLVGLWTTAAIAGLACWLLRDYIPAGVLKLVPIGLAALAANQFGTVMLQVLRAANRASAFARQSVAITLVGTAFSIFFVAVPRWGALGILAGMVVGNVMVLPFTLKKIAAEGSLRPRFATRETLIAFATYGFPLIAAQISSWALSVADRYIIRGFATAADVGLYSVTYTLGDKLMQLLIVPLMLTMSPVVIQTFEQQGQKLAEQVQTQFTRYYAMATFPLLFGMAAVAEDFMRVFAAEAYTSAYPVLAIVALGSMAYGLTQIAGQGVALHKKTTIIMTNTIAAATFNVIANIVLVPRIGYMAAAYNTVASYVLLLALTYLRSRPYMRWRLPWVDLARIIAAGAGMWALLGVIFPGSSGSILMLLAQAVVGLACYVVLLLLVGGVRADERAYAREIAGIAARKLFRRR